jgi:cytoskeletal protein RodZ
MATFGEKLREARERKGLRLEDVSRTTRVRVPYLEALERDDFDALPQDVFVRGFVRMCADCLAVDRDSLVAEYRRERERQQPTWQEDARNDVTRQMSRILETPREADAEKSRDLVKFAGLAVVVLALVGVWWIGAGRWDEARLARVERETVTPASVDAVPPPPASKSDAPPQTETPIEEPAEPSSIAPPVEPKPKPEPEPKSESVVGRLSVPESGVGTGIEHRQLTGESDRFVEGTPVWFWTRVRGGTRGETIRHVWKHEGHGSSSVLLTLGGEHWRTQSRKTLWQGSAGRWVVEALDGAGRVLARREFLCVSEASSRPF